MGADGSADGTEVSLQATAAEATTPPIRRRSVAAWALWDWGASGYSTIVTSFVFAPYLTGVVAKNRPPGTLSGETWLAISLFAAGFCVAAFAPVTGQRTDAGGRRKRSLAIWSALVIASTVGLFFVRDDYRYLALGLLLLAAGSAFLDFAQVSYNAMLQQISNRRNVGKISGIGWGSGYLGGIVVMLLAYVLFIEPEVVIFGVAANVVAAIGALGAGIVEDRIGPKPVILASLTALVMTAVVLLFAHGSTMFWIFGLLLCLWVGPAQSSSRTYVVRLAPAGREGQMFGLYATTGRAVSFLAPGLFALCSGVFGSPRMGIIGIVLVLLSGLLALARVDPPPPTPPILEAAPAA